MMRRATLSLFALVATLAGVAHAAPTPASPVVGQVAVAPEPVTVAPTLRAKLTNKKRFDPALLPVTHRGQTPVLKVKNGRSYQLLPSSDPVPRLSATPTLPAELEKDKARIIAWKPGMRPVLEAKDTTSNHIATQSSIKDQGPRGTCVAFSNMAGMEAWMKRKHNRSLDLSENHAFELFMKAGNGVCTPDGGVGLQSMLTLQTHGVCAESLFPYTSSCPGAIPAPCSNASERLRITQLFPLSFPNDPMAQFFRADNTALLEAMIANGWDIEYSIKVAGSDWSDSTAENGVIDVQTYANGDPVASVGNHGILIVGYNHAQQYFIFKNSWGADWGHAGYGHVSYDYIETYGRYGYAILGVGQ